MKKLFIIILLFMFLFVVACQPQMPMISSFEECVSAGNPIMESYPRQCRANGETFVEEIDEPIVPEETSFYECTQEDKESNFCTREYRPVCGLVDNEVRCITKPCASTDAKTFSNGCEACSGQSLLHYPGACEDQLFVVCGETVTGFDPVEFAETNNGLCVDICPGNYDPYVTQIGVELCIQRYGKEEISQWSTCERSSESCNCVKTYETTAGEEISDAEYRCVPEQYADRLLFRAGVDRLDENGENSVMIA